jgi:hypothetical protein
LESIGEALYNANNRLVSQARFNARRNTDDAPILAHTDDMLDELQLIIPELISVSREICNQKEPSPALIAKQNQLRVFSIIGIGMIGHI